MLLTDFQHDNLKTLSRSKQVPHITQERTHHKFPRTILTSTLLLAGFLDNRKDNSVNAESSIYCTRAFQSPLCFRRKSPRKFTPGDVLSCHICHASYTVYRPTDGPTDGPTDRSVVNKEGYRMLARTCKVFRSTQNHHRYMYGGSPYL